MDSITLGTRGSELALAQVDRAEVALRAAGFEGVIERRVIKTSGDQRLDIRLSDFSREGVVTQGVFTKELEAALLAGEIDAAVHSMKDLPSRLSSDFGIAAVMERAPVEDVLVTRASARAFADLQEGATLATGSVRRERIAAWLRPDLCLVDIRGNVPTRLTKLARGEAGDATLLARAGLERLGLYRDGMDQIEIDGAVLGCRELPVEQFVPAAAQGAVAIETLAGAPVADVLGRIGHLSTALRVEAERHFLMRLGAGCDTPVGVHAQLGAGGVEMSLSAVVFDDGADRREPLAKGQVRGEASSPGALADRLMEKLGLNDDG